VTAELGRRLTAKRRRERGGCRTGARILVVAPHKSRQKYQ
jgi:hypothetical protein